jgi:trehalose 6-phosphate phosphatase
VALPVPISVAGAAGLRAMVASPDRAVVALDFDGTLAPIVDDPALARPHRDAAPVLRALARRISTVAILSGRPAEFSVAALRLEDNGFDDAEETASNIVVLGHYGLERWTPHEGIVRLSDVDPARVDGVREALPRMLAELGVPPGTRIEDKGEAIAVHVRATADPAAAMLLLRGPLEKLAAANSLRLEPGRLVLELRPAGIDKGTALAALVSSAAAESVCYVGDDLGDLAAFDTIERLRQRGVVGLAVCSGSDEVPELAARADLIVDGPSGVIEFLDALADAL